jgi:hypothetical protein
MPAPAGQPQGAGDPQGNRGQGVPEPAGHVMGMPYDWRKPTRARVRARWWNPDDPRMFPPKSFGMGWGLNAYWLRHPVRYVTNGS